ncbi:Stp1/IreP family PP2C-type Ser/Thr phosphatase [Salibacterium halotolerans]|uniref:Stp1/IreP family PP2C-type Ser/Thr phosphatase n=1 Tax=Salibacterium halotolerans TaxID=1884432 RepID=UPI000B827684|nr:Stp1/IreP family PP2C-type Ser/Thr phosphatase [Salibacterium halotolerans]
MDKVYVTDTGIVREHNEDDGGIFTNEAGDYLAVVADGMGGHQAGDVASRMTVNLLRSVWEPIHQSFSVEEAEHWLKEQIRDVNRRVYEQAASDQKMAGMGTTVVAAMCMRSFTVIAHVGDSRAYQLSEYELNLITEDHSLVNELKKSGQLTEEEANDHPRKNVLMRAVGTEENVDIETASVQWQAGEGLLLCSDGLTNKLNADNIQEHLQAPGSLHERAVSLIHTAKERGGEDNITLAVILQSSLEKEVE